MNDDLDKIEQGLVNLETIRMDFGDVWFASQLHLNVFKMTGLIIAAMDSGERKDRLQRMYDNIRAVAVVKAQSR